MKLTDICIKRPIFATVLSLILVLFGLLGYKNLETRYFPNVESHTIRVHTQYPGAGARLIEKKISTPIENSLSMISGIESLNSNATQDQSTVTIKFKPDADFDAKVNEVREKIAGVQSDLPDLAKTPVVDVSDNADMLMDIAFTSNTMNSQQVRDYLERYIKDRFQEMNGVANVEVWGSSRYAMRLWLDPEKMASKNVSVSDIQQAVLDNNLQLPAGSFKSKTMNFPISENFRLTKADEFNELIINDMEGKTTRLKDIGFAELGTEQQSMTIRYDGKPAVALGIFLESGANPIKMADKVFLLMKHLKSSLPKGMDMQLGFDVSTFFKQSVDEVYTSIMIAVLGVLLVVWLFLGSWRSVIIPIVTIPICVIGAFAVIALFGFSINILTLLAIVLAIGLVVDDAVVMLENIYRHIEQGVSPFKAALIGSKEIAFAIIAMTLTLAAVYAPIGFLTGRAAMMFREFAFTLAGAVLLSGFVALTLSPSLCALLLNNKQPSSYVKKLDQIFEGLRTQYGRLLETILKYRIFIIIILLIIAGIGYFIFNGLPKAFIPREEIGIVSANVTAPTGSNADYTRHYMEQIENQFKTVKEKQSVFAFTGYGGDENAQINLLLKPVTERHRSAQAIADDLNKNVMKIPGVNAFVYAMSPFNHNKGRGLQFYILTTESYLTLKKTIEQVINQLKEYPGLMNLDTDIKFDSQEYTLNVNRALANESHVSLKSIAETISTLLGGNYITDFYMGNQNYRIIAQATKAHRKNPAMIQKFYVRNSQGQQVPLTNLVNFTPQLSMPSLQHYQRLRAATISAQLAPGYHLSEVVNHLQKQLPTVLPSHAKFTFVGEAKKMLDSSYNMAIIFVFAIIFIYLVLAAQFESFIDPFIILLTVPLSIVSALVTLKLIHGSLNLYTNIGLITLVGLITKHGILITQFANQLRQEGIPIQEAIIKAATIRLRPILMTTAAMILGAIPLILVAGYGAIGRSQIGWVIISGLFFGTFFSLIVVPIAYSYLGQLKHFTLGHKHI